ncbi:MAG: Ig-like domain-containing protein [Gammaproteobacteria bacterium]
MTKLRAFYGALACGAASLCVVGTASAAVNDYRINEDPAESFQSNVDNACVAALPGVTGEDCTYNRSNPVSVPLGTWVGPVRGGGYYQTGNSPFVTLPLEPGGQLAPAPVPDPANTRLTLSGTLSIDDVDDIECNGNDTVEARIELPAGTRSFAGGPGTWAEETWGDNTIAYVLGPAVPDQQNAIAEGCEYIFGDDGFPATLLQTQGLFNGVQTYPVDLSIGADPVNPPEGEQDAWDTGTLGAIGIGSFEAAGFDGNNGIRVFLDEQTFYAGQWSCDDNIPDAMGNPRTLSMVSNGQCTFDPGVGGSPCRSAGSHFCGVRGIGDPNFVGVLQPDDGKGQENWIVRIVVDPSGEIVVPAQIFANNESVVFNTVPAPVANNSWDGPLMTFTAACLTCSIAKDDTYTVLRGTPTTLDIGANDDPAGVLDTNNTSLTIATQGQLGTCDASGNTPGNVTDLACVYTGNAVGQDTFTYTLADGTVASQPGLTATVTVTIDENNPPIAGDLVISFDSEGIDPATLNASIDALSATDPVTTIQNSGGDDPRNVAIDGTETQGIATLNLSPQQAPGDPPPQLDTATISYQAFGSFFQGEDTFGYSITDSNFGSLEETVNGTVTVRIPNVLPTTSATTATLGSGGGVLGGSVDVRPEVTLGNGTIDQHIAGNGICDQGTLAVEATPRIINGTVRVFTTYSVANLRDQATCTYTLTDEDGGGDEISGTITITAGAGTALPGAGSALGPWSLALLILPALLRSRRATLNSGAK